MQQDIKDFVGVYNNAFTNKFCDSLIQHYEFCVEAGIAEDRKKSENVSKHLKDDTQIYWSREPEISLSLTRELHKEFNTIFWECYEPYADKYSPLKDADKHNIFSVKTQKTKIGEGYHIWHFESASRACANRLLTFILYLNDVEEGGETELLYQSRRIKPQKGTLTMFPASFTHTHRGNPPLSNDKYIVTGWVEF